MERSSSRSALSTEYVIMMQTLTMMVKMSLETEEGELVAVDEFNNKSLDNHPFPLSESGNNLASQQATQTIPWRMPWTQTT